jgi:hypothetical protein
MRIGVSELDTWRIVPATALIVVGLFTAKGGAKQSGKANEDNPDTRPPVTKADVKIAQRARKILDSASKWNRADTRVCPANAKSFSIYCALEKATVEVRGNFQHRGAAMQEARFVIDEIAPNRNYQHRLMDYNNDPRTTFADVQKVLQLIQDRVVKQLSETSASPR